MSEPLNPGRTEGSDATASRTRRQLQELLRRSDTPLDVYDLAGSTGLHITTVRFHLDVLLRAGLISAQTLARSTPGRPRTVYSLRAGETSFDSYRPLAAVLAANLGGTPGIRRRRAEKAGRDWAASLVPVVDSPSDATHRITALFAEMKFDPQLADPVPGSGEQDIRLRACPYRDVARAHPEVVCALHLGLLQGALTRLGAASSTAKLLPFVEPTLCIARLSPAQPPSTPPAPPPEG